MTTRPIRSPLTLPALLLAGLGALAAPAPARADLLVLTTTHIDVRIAYEDGRLGLALFDEDAGVGRDPADVFLPAGGNARFAQPADPRFNFLGAGASNPVWILPQAQDPLRLYFGVGTEDVPEDVFLADQVSLNLVAVRGPGQFSVWQTDAFGAPVVFMATSDGIESNDRILIGADSEAHFNWGFTAPGLYEVDLQVVGFLAESGDAVRSPVVTYTFGIEVLPPGGAIPEPSAFCLLALGGGLVAAGGWRRRRAGGVRL